MENYNFSCSTCKKTFFISSYTMTGSGTYLHKGSKEQLRCDCESKTVLSIVDKEWDGGCPTFTKIASMSPQERSEVLKKRSKAHFNKEIRERKHEMNKGFNNDVKNLMQK